MKRRKDLTLQQKISALDELKQGKKRKDIAAQLGVGVSTIGDWIADEKKLRQIQMSNRNIHCKRQRVSKYEDVNVVLTKWFHQQRANNVIVNGPLLMEKATQFSIMLGIEGFSASQGWLESWKKRNNVSFMKMQGEKGSANFSDAEQWMKKLLPDLTDDYVNVDSYNADETSLLEENDKAISLLDDERQMMKLEIQSAISVLNTALRMREIWLMTQVDIITNSLQSSLRKKRDTLHEFNGYLSHRDSNNINLTEAHNMMMACKNSSCGDISLKLFGNLEEVRLNILNFGRIVKERRISSGCLTNPQQCDFNEENWSEKVDATKNPTSCDSSLVLSSHDVKQSSPVDHKVAKTTQSDASNMIESYNSACSLMDECVTRIKKSPSHIWITKSTDPCSNRTDTTLTQEPIELSCQSFQTDNTLKNTTVYCDSSLVLPSCDIKRNSPKDQCKFPLRDEFKTENGSLIDEHVTRIKDSPSHTWNDESRDEHSDSAVMTLAWKPFKFSMESCRTEGSNNENVTPDCSFEPFCFCYKKSPRPNTQLP